MLKTIQFWASLLGLWLIVGTFLTLFIGAFIHAGRGQDSKS